MKHLFLLLVLLAFSLLGAVPASFDKEGRLRMEEMTFHLDFWDEANKQTYSQAKNGYFKLTESKSENGIQLCKGTYNFDGKRGTWTAKLTPSGEEATYECQYDGAFVGGSLNAVLPISNYVGQTVYIDGKPISLQMVKPEGASNNYLNLDAIHSFGLPTRKGLLTFTSQNKIRLLIQDFRPRKNIFNLHIYAQKDSVKSTYFHKLQLSFIPYDTIPIDLRAAANMGFQDKVANDAQGGWTDQGPDNDLRSLPVGQNKFEDTLFDIIDPAKNNGKSCLVLRGGERMKLDKVLETSVQGNIHGKWLFLLHARAWATGGDELGTITITYADGTKSEITPKRNVHAGNWWKPKKTSDADIVWSATNAKNEPIGLYRSAHAIEDKQIRHIRFESADNSLWLVVAASVGQAIPLTPKNVPYVITQGQEWQPIDFALNQVKPGSAMDFSWRLDKPAGKYGPAVLRNGHLEFRDRPGKPLRFYGSNLCFDACYLERDEAERVADSIAALGFNLIRFHHHDGAQSRRPLMTSPNDSTKLNSEAMDKLDYLYYCLKQRGIYITTDLYISRRPGNITIPEYPRPLSSATIYKALFWISDAVYENWLKHTTERLNHVNRYTGKAFKDDPALITINIINEGNILDVWNKDGLVIQAYEKRFQQWLQDKGLSPKDKPERERLMNQFLLEVYHQRFAQAVKDLRALGLKVPLSDQNMNLNLTLTQIRTQYDYVDTHFYINHPRFSINRWAPPIVCDQDSYLKKPFYLWKGLTQAHLLDRPFSISELDFCKPNLYRGEGPVLVGAMSGLQDLDILVHFAYAHQADHALQNNIATNTFDISNDPLKFIVHRIGSSLFLGSGIQPTRTTFVIVCDNKTKLPRSLNTSESFSQLSVIAKTGILLVSSEEELQKKLPQGAILLKPAVGFPEYAEKYGKVLSLTDKDLLDKALEAAGLRANIAKDGTISSEGNAIAHNIPNKTFRATAKDCEAFVLPEKQRLQGKYLTVNNRKNFGVFGAISLNSEPIDQTSRLLFIHATTAQAYRARFSSEEMTELQDWGKDHFLVKDGQADVSLKLAPGSWKVWAIDTSGKRLAEIPAAYQDGILRFRTSVFHKFGSVFAYELVQS
ncbi:MAG: hypothetical protein IJJ26_11980 [Victivallales bacterium]|nr:hypothetical protein [Victivallales bacterium]